MKPPAIMTRSGSFKKLAVTAVAALALTAALTGCSSEGAASDADKAADDVAAAKGASIEMVSTEKIYNLQTEELMASSTYTWDEDGVTIATNLDEQATAYTDEGVWIAPEIEGTETYKATVGSDGSLTAIGEESDDGFAITENGGIITDLKGTIGDEEAAFEFDGAGFMTGCTVGDTSAHLNYTGPAHKPEAVQVTFGDYTQNYVFTYDADGLLREVRCTELLDKGEAVWSGNVLAAEYTYAEVSDAKPWEVAVAKLKPVNYLQLTEL